MNKSEMITHSNGNKEWYLNSRLHRENGPAVEYINGDKYWYLKGKRHRIDGPAIEFVNGNKLWYQNGIKLTHFQIFKVILNNYFFKNRLIKNQ